MHNLEALISPMLTLAVLLGAGLGWHCRMRMRGMSCEQMRAAFWAVAVTSTGGALFAAIAWSEPVGGQAWSASPWWMAMQSNMVYARAGLGALVGIWIGILASRWLSLPARAVGGYQFSLRHALLALAAAGPVCWLLWNWPVALVLVAAQQSVLLLSIHGEWPRSRSRVANQFEAEAGYGATTTRSPTSRVP
jgi:hypothetical protein